MIFPWHFHEKPAYTILEKLESVDSKNPYISIIQLRPFNSIKWNYNF